MSFIIFLILSTLIEAIKIEEKLLCNPREYKIVDAKFGSETHKLCLKMKPIESTSLTRQDSALILNPEEEYDPTEEFIKGFRLSEFTMANGFPAENPSSGSAEGYIGDDHQFYGVLHLGNRTLHADPYGKDNPNSSFGTFENDMPSSKQKRHAQVDNDHYFPYQIEDPSRTHGIARARICDLLLLADKRFFDNDANSSLNHVVRRMIHAVAQADVIFRNTDFNEDGVPDNIGFQVKYVVVLTTNETNRRIFGNLQTHQTVDGKEYLLKFARLHRLAEVCLGVAFTGHAFRNRTLGLSFTSLGGVLGSAAGGLCDRRAYGRSYNTLAVAHATTDYTNRVPERVAALTLAHELGHSFGAHHDDSFSNEECRGYLMGGESSHLTTDQVKVKESMEFSICSKRLISATLNSMSYCLTDDNKAFCGNGIVEKGEVCDCGLPSQCNLKDPCCTPRAGAALHYGNGSVHKEGCSVSPTAECHPSQGPCCRSDCTYDDLSMHGIVCKDLDAACKCNDPRSCKCGLGGRCLSDTSCHAAECALLGLRECQCDRSPGGMLGELRKCGICCEIPAMSPVNDRCVGVETAANELATNGTLPEEWPGDDYIGPNITISICKDSKCSNVSIRAWSVNTWCVSRGIVGRCDTRGVCSVMRTPRSNVYPDVIMQYRAAPPNASYKNNGRTMKNYFILFSVTIIKLFI